VALGVAAACLLAASGARAGGQAGGAASSLSATSLTFTPEPVGTVSAPQTITLTNTGSAVLNIVTLSVLGPDFSETNTCGNSVAAGTNCAIYVTFDPLSYGTGTGTVVITSSASNSPQTVTLEGMGMGPALTFSSATVNFPSQLVSTTSPQETVYVSSSGDEPLTIANITVTGPFNSNNTCVTSVLNAGGSCTISVYFTPVAGGPATGQMTIYDDAYPATQTIALNGTGADFSVSLTPTSNSTTAGQSANYSVSVTPIGGFSGTVALGCGALQPTLACSFAPSTVTVSGSSPATSTVTVTTIAASRVPPGGSRRMPPGGIWLRPLWLWILALGFAGLAVSRRKRAGLTPACAVAAALLLAALTMPACGGNSPKVATVTSPGTYAIVVAGTTPAGSNTVQSTAVLTLVVN
jgi:hypothetical protein